MELGVGEKQGWFNRPGFPSLQAPTVISASSSESSPWPKSTPESTMGANPSSAPSSSSPSSGSFPQTAIVAVAPEEEGNELNESRGRNHDSSKPSVNFVPEEQEPWCKRYMELYQELRENWERLYWEEGYSNKLGQEHANYESAEDDDQDFSPYRLVST